MPRKSSDGLTIRKAAQGWVVEQKLPDETVPTVRSGYLRTKREAQARVVQIRRLARMGSAVLESWPLR